MTNNWNIPDWLEKRVRERDKSCVYCHVKFRPNFKDRATWEHIDNDEKNISEGNIFLCCTSCNSSKGTKNLTDWLNSKYCKMKNITNDAISVRKVG
jgi:hypothetical protein